MTKSTLDIKIDDDLITYLNKKRKTTLTLTVRKSGGGCCPTIEIAEVEVVKPDNINTYRHFTVDNIDVYISNTTRVTAPVLRFQLQSTFIFKEIVPIGITLIGQ